MSEQNGLAVRDVAAVVEQVVINGDLSKLSSSDRVAYYRQLCESLSLNPLSKPFDYLTLNGRLVLYAKRDATDQLRKLHNVSVVIVSRERVDDVYVVTARATLPNGRADESIGAVSIGGLKGDALANALMKAETKSKRRVTLSIVGLGLLDETEVDTIPDARAVAIEDDPPPAVEPPRVVPVGHAAKPERINAPFELPVNKATGRRYTEAEMRDRYRALIDKAHVLGLHPTLPGSDAPLPAIVAAARSLYEAIQAAESQIPLEAAT